jgi:hypothetical protein
MPMKGSGTATDWREIDRYDDGVGWLAHPDEGMQRASHALFADDEVWLVDPVDVPDLDDFLAEFGEVAGVVVLLDRHKRDAATVANRHDVPVVLPRALRAIRDDFDTSVEVTAGTIAGLQQITVLKNPFWREVALFDPDEKTLVVPEAVGTVDYYCAPGESLGVHPMLRAFPPRDELGSLDPERLLVGHGEGILTDAAGELATALRGSRSRMLSLYGGILRDRLGR